MINEYHLGFILGPQINAGGRVGDSRMSVNLLTSKINRFISDCSKTYEFNNLRKSYRKES